MIDKFKTATPSKTEGNFITPAGRLIVFGNSLFQASLPKGERDPEKARFQLTLLVPKEADMGVLTKAVDAAIDDNVSAKVRQTTKVKKPWLKTEDQPRYAEFADEFPVMIRCNAKFRPDVISPAGHEIKEEQAPDEVYSGRWARVSVRPFFYDHPSGGKGVSLGLQNVQLLDHDDAIAGGRVKGTTEFDAVSDEADPFA